MSSSPGGRSVDPRSPAQRYSVSAEQVSLARQNEALTKRLEELERLVRGAQVHPTKPLPPIHKDRQPLFREMEREAERLNPQGESIQRLVVVNDVAGFGGNPPAALKGDDVLAWAEEYARKARTCHMTDEVAISLMVQYVEPALQEKVRPVIDCTVATGSHSLEMVLTEVKNLFGAEVSSRYYKRMLDAVQWIGARSTGDKIRLLSLREAAVRGVDMDEKKAMRRYASKVPEEMRTLAFMAKRQTNSLAELVKTLVDAEWDSVEMERLKKTGTASAVPSSVAPKVSEPVDQVSAVGDRCFSCGKEGHFARDCHQQQRKESRQPEPQPQDGRRGFSRERDPGMDSSGETPWTLQKGTPEGTRRAENSGETLRVRTLEATPGTATSGAAAAPRETAKKATAATLETARSVAIVATLETVTMAIVATLETATMAVVVTQGTAMRAATVVIPETAMSSALGTTMVTAGDNRRNATHVAAQWAATSVALEAPRGTTREDHTRAKSEGMRATTRAEEIPLTQENWGEPKKEYPGGEKSPTRTPRNQPTPRSGLRLGGGNKTTQERSQDCHPARNLNFREALHRGLNRS